MVIQSFNVSASSQHTLLSVQSGLMLAPSPHQTLQAASIAVQDTTASQPKVAGNNEIGGKDMFMDALKQAKDERDETVRGLVRASPESRIQKTHGHKMPKTPRELRASLSQIIYEWLASKGHKFRRPELGSNANQANSLINFGGIFGSNFGDRLQNVGAAHLQMFHYESETVTYSAQGIINTADGKTISLDISMSMSREFVSYMNFSSETNLVDPIVINYGGTAASLTGEKFLFDLTSDGNLESISMLAEGSGFLAIDRNGDGAIKDGSQLFGPNSGCGFSELRKYDTDGNGWIDENDEIFAKLVVWSRDKDGNDIVKTLKELGIGAIFLGDITTEFSFKGDNSETLGVMRSTSFFIKECGGSGTLSHIDLTF